MKTYQFVDLLNSGKGPYWKFKIHEVLFLLYAPRGSYTHTIYQISFLYPSKYVTTSLVSPYNSWKGSTSFFLGDSSTEILDQLEYENISEDQFDMMYNIV